MPFVPTSRRIDAKSLYPAARKLVLASKLKPQPLDMAEPHSGNRDLALCMMLGPAHPQWLSMLRGWIVSYAKAGMNLDLCEYAAVRDAMKSLKLNQNSMASRPDDFQTASLKSL